MNIDVGSNIVRKWLDSAKTDKERARRSSAIAKFHGLVIYACSEAKTARVPLPVIEGLLRGLGDPCPGRMRRVSPETLGTKG